MLFYMILEHLALYGARTAIEITVHMPEKLETVKTILLELKSQGFVVEDNGRYKIP